MRIVAIGGGDLRLNETFEIDKFIVNLTGKENPKALFIPTASGEPEGYINTFNEVYKDKLNCTTDTLLLKSADLSDAQIEKKIMASDLVYVGGGNTRMMIDIWKQKKIDKYLKNAGENGTILSGLSAGAICWFRYGHSDSERFDGQDGWEYILVDGLGFINAAFCPHYNEEGRNGFDKMISKIDLNGVAIDNNCAIFIEDDKFKIIKGNEKANAYLLKSKCGEIDKSCLDNKEFMPLEKITE